MSGGVDSSVAAARLVAAGHEVVGVTLHLWDYPDDGSVKGRCCAPEDIHDARRVSDALGIPHYAFDRRSIFREQIVQPFVDAYLAGGTPSPCVHCNRSVKINELVQLAARLNATFVATGHYARIVEEKGGPALYRGRDARKDQSYFLHMLGPEILRMLLFPLGESTKEEVRAEAKQLGLAGAGKGESQELCFVPTGRYDELIEREAAGRIRPGPILDESGKVIGEHAGVHRFTIGQRRNLGISVGHRTYVVGIDPETASVRLGAKEELLCSLASVDQLALPPDVALPLDCEVAVRYGGQSHPANVSCTEEGEVLVRFRQPVSAVVLGQFAVFYRGDRVLGGGRICRTRPEAA